jgi:hypothetical protein
MMSASTQIKRGLLYANDLENSSSVASIVSNVAAIIVDVAIRRCRAGQQRTNHGSIPGRTFRQRKRRSVQGIYKELGKVYFRRAYQMNYRTFKRLAVELHPYITKPLVRKDEQDTNQMDRFLQMSNLLVPLVGLLVAQHLML